MAPVVHAEGLPKRYGDTAVLAVFMIPVGMAACVRPTLRAIRIQPVDALKG